MRISWGQPAKIAEARLDHRCSVCHKRELNEIYDGKVMVAAQCRFCGWSFSFEDEDMEEENDST